VGGLAQKKCPFPPPNSQICSAFEEGGGGLRLFALFTGGASWVFVGLFSLLFHSPSLCFFCGEVVRGKEGIGKGKGEKR